DLVEQLGGPKTPGVGFAIGIERVIEALKRENIEVESESEIDVYIAFQGEKGEMAAVTLSKELKKKGINTYLNISKRNLSGQFKHAHRLNAKYVVVIGDEEISNDIVTIKNMKNGEQTQIERNWVSEIIMEKLREE
ncbi:MAG: Histidine--tRNA ligase, partial [Petrotoga mobilis]